MVVLFTEITSLDSTKKPNQEKHFDFSGSLPKICFAKKYLLICVDSVSKIPTVQLTTAVITKLLQKNIIIQAIPRMIRTDQGSGFLAKSISEFCTQNNIKLIFAPAGNHQSTDLVDECVQGFHSKTQMKQVLKEIIHNIRTTAHQQMGCRQFKVHIDF